MKKRTIAIAAVGALAIASAIAAVSAQGHRGGYGGGHSMFGDDEAGHGMRGRFGRALTKDEFEARNRERFARIDRNSDGVIDTAEIEASMAERRSGFMARRGKGEATAPGEMNERMLRRLGAGSDGKLTREAFRTEITRRFAEADLNNDGRIDDADLPPMLRGRNVLAGNVPAGGPMLQWLRLLQVSPKDGAISRDDVLAAADRQFDRLDRNKDGVVDKVDTEAIAKEMTDYRVKRFIHSFGADKDGRISREQFQAKAAERFARMDYNSDGSISRDEQPGWGHGRRGGHMGDRMMRDGAPGDQMEGPGMGPRSGRHGGAGPGPGPAEAPPAKN